MTARADHLEWVAEMQTLATLCRASEQVHTGERAWWILRHAIEHVSGKRLPVVTFNARVIVEPRSNLVRVA